MSVKYKDLGHHFPVYRALHGIGESQYWKNLYYGVTLDDEYTWVGTAEVDDAGAADTDDDEPFARAWTDMIVRAIYAIPKAAHTGADTNYKILSLVNKEAGGAGAVVVGHDDFVNGTNLVAFDDNVIPLAAALADRQVLEGEVLDVELTHGGTGKAFNTCMVGVEVEPYVDLTNEIVREEILLKAQHKMLVLGAYVVSHAGAVTGADTNTASINIVNKGQAGAGTAEPASIDFTTGIDTVQHIPSALTLSTTEADLVVARGDVVVAQVIKAGTGLQLHETSVVLWTKAIE